MRDKLWVVVLLGAYDVIQDGAYMAQLEIIEKQGKLNLFDARQVNYDIIKHFTAFCEKLCFFYIKNVNKTIAIASCSFKLQLRATSCALQDASCNFAIECCS